MSEILNHIPIECHGYFDTTLQDRGVVIIANSEREAQLAFNLCLSIKVNGKCSVTLVTDCSSGLTEKQQGWFDCIDEFAANYKQVIVLHPSRLWLPKKDINDIFQAQKEGVNIIEQCKYHNSKKATRHVMLRDYYFIEMDNPNRFMIAFYEELRRKYSDGRIESYAW